MATAPSISNLQPPGDWSLAQLCHSLGNVPLDRIRLYPSPGRATEADLLALDGRGLWELVGGTLIRKAMGQYESELSSILIRLLGNYVDEHDLGKVFAPDCMTRIEPGRIREPDVSFVSWARLPRGPRNRDPVLSVAPNLAIEVLSESNTPQEMEAKRLDYFSIGVEEVWEIDPATRKARIYSAPEVFHEVEPDGLLEGGSILPGWQLPLAELFARADRMGPRP